MKAAKSSLSIQSAVRQMSPDVFDAKRWFIGFSGGADSTVLLHALVHAFGTVNKGSDESSSPEIIALHVHHGLNAHADDWLVHCQKFCDGLNIRFLSVRVILTQKASVENAAREARYKAFAQYIESDDVLMLGHHQGDQAETVLFRLFRGSGIKGLGAMKLKSTREFDDTSLQLVRPLLNCSKNVILNYAQEHNLTWVEDATNEENSVDRNFIRNQILPLIENRWPAASEKIAQLSYMAQAQQAIVNEWCDDKLQNCDIKRRFYGFSLSSALLLQFSPEERTIILHRWGERLGETISQHQHQQIEQGLQQPTNEYAVELNHYVIRFFDGDLFLVHKHFVNKNVSNGSWFHQEHKPIDIIIGLGETVKWYGGEVTLVSLESPTESEYSKGGFIDTEKLKGKILTLRLRKSTWVDAGIFGDDNQSAEIIRIANRGSRKIKRILQEKKLEPWLRAYVPLLYADDDMVAIADIAVDEQYIRSLQSTQCVKLVWNL